MTPGPVIQVIAPARFVTLQLAESITGLTVKAMERKIEKGQWAEGIHYRKRDGRTFLDLKGYEKWVETEPA